MTAANSNWRYPRRQIRVAPIPITDDSRRRTWRGVDKATDAQMTEVLVILFERGRQTQAELAQELAANLDLNLGTARAAVCASLLHFRTEGWARAVGRDGRSTVWEVVA